MICCLMQKHEKARLCRNVSMLIWNCVASQVTILCEGKVKISWPSVCETRDKRSLGGDPDSSWCHRHTSVKHTRMLQPISMQPWAATKKSFKLVWGWHHLLSGSIPNGHLSPVLRRLYARPRTFHLALVGDVSMLALTSLVKYIKFFLFI